MKKTKAILLILSIIAFILIISQITVNAESTYTGRTYIDSPADTTVEGKMRVNGWYMTSDEEAEVRIYIDGQEVKKTLEKREERQDVLESVTGCGTPEQNSKPGFSYIIEDDIQIGEHDVEIKIYSRDGEVLATHSQHFYYAGYKATTYIENPASQGEIITANNKMWGWFMSNDEKAEIKILVDNVEQEVSIKRNIRTDVTSAITEYGTEQENPKPGYEFCLNVENISDGEHTLTVQIKSHNGELLSQDTRTIVVNKYIAKAYIDHPTGGEKLAGKIEMNGWIMTTDEQATTKVFIDNKEVQKLSENREDRTDVINAIDGYGDEKINPQPGIKYVIDSTGIEEGEHTITLQVISREGNVIEEQKETFNYENYKAKMYLENPAKDGEVITANNRMWGWVMTNDKNAKVKILIDDVEQEIEIKRTVRNDVISAVTGYGYIKTNPTPGYEFKLDVEKITDGEHILKVQTISENGQILAEDTRTIIVNKYVAKAYIDYPAKEILTNQIELSGWVMTTDAKAQIKIYIDGIESNIISEKREERPDVLNAIKGYGDETINPKPGISYVIDRTGIEPGEHEITLKVISREGNVIEEQTETFKIYKTEMVIESPRTTQITSNQLTVGGWVLSELEDKKLVIKFDNDVIQNVELKTREDLESLLPEYGGKEINPTPWFEAVIDLSYYTGIQHQITVQLCSKTTGEVIKQEVLNIDLVNNFKREVITYGYSGAYLRGVSGGTELICYKYGEGPNVMFATFCLHGFEDSWRADGEVLVNAGKQFYERLLADKDVDLAKKWTIYIFPEVNPDGRRLGYTNDGPGRTTLYSEVGQGIDINRSWQTGSSYVTYTDSRNYNGTQGFQAYEAKYLRDFLLQHKSKDGQTVLVDLHGWQDQLIGDEEICKYYKTQYPSCRTTGYGRYGTQYLITWARQNLGAKVSLVELPLAKDYSEVINMRLIEKYIEGTLQMLRGI